MVLRPSTGEPAITVRSGWIAWPCRCIGCPGDFRRNRMSTAPDSPTITPAGDSGTRLRVTSWDVGYLASAIVVMVGSLVPLLTVRWGVNLWGVYNLFFIGIGVLLPLAAAGFLLARAASGNATRAAGPRLGSLSTEQFSHVAAWLALA